LGPSSNEAKAKAKAKVKVKVKVKAKASWIARIDVAARAGLLVGLAFYALPLWQQGRLRVAFWLTLASTLIHVFTSHRRAGEP
jgi:hypothetical protein